MRIAELEEALVARVLHDVDLLGRPAVHVEGAHKAEVHPKGAVKPAALVADEDAEGGRGPLWVRGIALGAELLKRDKKKKKKRKKEKRVVCDLGGKGQKDEEQT